MITSGFCDIMTLSYNWGDSMPDMALNFINFIKEHLFQFGIIILVVGCWWKKRKEMERNKKNIVLALYAWIVDCKIILDRYCLEESRYCPKFDDAVFKGAFNGMPSEIPMVDGTVGDNEIENSLLVLKQKYGNVKDTMGNPIATAKTVDGHLVACTHPYWMRDYFLSMRELMNIAYNISKTVNENNHIGIDFKTIDRIMTTLNKISI